MLVSWGAMEPPLEVGREEEVNDVNVFGVEGVIESRHGSLVARL